MSKNIAVAYSLMRRNKKNKMARGGEVEHSRLDQHMEPSMADMDDEDMLVAETMKRHKMMAEGGMLEEDERDEALELNDMVPPNKMHNEFNYDAAEDHIGDEEAMEDASAPKDGNEHGNDDEEEILRETSKRMRSKMRK